MPKKRAIYKSFLIYYKKLESRYFIPRGYILVNYRVLKYIKLDLVSRIYKTLYLFFLTASYYYYYKVILI